MKAYALIIGTYCSKAIQSQVEEHPDFELTIRDDPIELLKTINILMHDTVRAKYPYASLYDAMMRLFNLRQQEHEHLTDYVKRFKQSKDVVKAHMRSKWLELFVEHTEEYQKETDTKQQSELKDQSFERYMAFVLLRNSDQAKDRRLEQDEFDMRYQAEIKQFLDRQSGREKNLMKAYALIFGTYCSKTIQSRVEEHPDFELTIRDDPIELLKTINILMHDTVRAKYPYASLCDVMMRLATRA